MALPKFYLEPRPSDKKAINMFYSFYGDRLQYYCGIRIDPKFYREKDSKGNPIDRSDVNKLISDSTPYAAQIKANLKQIALDVQNIANTAKAMKVPVTKELLRTELDKIHKHKEIDKVDTVEYSFISFYEKHMEDMKTGKRLMDKGKKAGQKFSHNAIKNYGSSLSAVKRYLSYKKINKLHFADVNKEFYEGFRDFCFKIEEKQPSTFAGFIKDIKSVMNEAGTLSIETGNGHKIKSFIIPSYEADTIYLNEEQIEKISNLDLSDGEKFVEIKIIDRDNQGKAKLGSKSEKLYKKKKVTYAVLDKARDLALVGFYTGLRFSNFANLDPKSIEKDFVKLKQVKTGGLVTIPIMQKLRPVLLKYSDNLPTLSNQRFNDYIKLIAELAGLTDTIKINNFKGNIKTVEELRICDIISSHTCRRSYATNMFKRGIPTMLIMSATGHLTESSFLTYIRATNEDKARLMADILKKQGL